MPHPTSSYPRFFEVEDTLVRLDLEEDGDTVTASTSTGFPYSIGRALAEGREITEDEYNRLVAKTAMPR